MKFKILDTGYISDLPLASQVQFNPVDRAGYDGASTVHAMTLDTEHFSWSEAVNTDGKSIINDMNPHNTKPVASKNPVIRITVLFDKEYITTGHQYNQMDTMRRFQHTKGLKILYPSELNDPNLVEALGVRNNGAFHSSSPTDLTGTILTGTPYLLGITRNYTINDSSTDKWRVTFEFEVTRP
jgi:hypothetical protein